MGVREKDLVKLFKKSLKQNLTIDELLEKLKKIDSDSYYRNSKIGILEGYDIHVKENKYFYVEKVEKRWSLSSFQKKLNSWYCPPPFFIVGEGDFITEIDKLASREDFDGLIYSIITPINMATIYNKMIFTSPVLSKHKSTIFEAMEAHWLGLDYVSTDSVVSVFESSLREIVEKSGFGRPSLKFQSYLRKMSIDRLSEIFSVLETYAWYPYKSNNRQHSIDHRGSDEENNLWVLLDNTMDAINAILIWFSDVLYKEYDESKEDFSLNRHNFFHGFSEREAKPVYLPLMIWSLLSLIYIERIFIKADSLFFPECDEDDRALGRYFVDLGRFVGDKRRTLVKDFGVAY